jgi:transposase
VEQAERPVQAVSYERRVPAAERRPAPEKAFEKLPVQEIVVIEPEVVKAAPEAYEKIGEEKTFAVEITPPKLFKRDGAKRRWTRRKRGPGTK